MYFVARLGGLRSRRRVLCLSLLLQGLIGGRLDEEREVGRSGGVRGGCGEARTGYARVGLTLSLWLWLRGCGGMERGGDGADSKPVCEWEGRWIRLGRLREQGVVEVPLRRSGQRSRWHGVENASDHAPADTAHGVVDQWSRMSSFRYQCGLLGARSRRITQKPNN
jgi:hypothetical protein